jgi:hypothetical protein
MIKSNATLTIQRIALECLQVKEYQSRYPQKLMQYIQLLNEHPGEYAGLIHVVPSNTHNGMFCILEGHHRYVASIMAGRSDALCVIVEGNE